MSQSSFFHVGNVSGGEDAPPVSPGIVRVTVHVSVSAAGKDLIAEQGQG
jgi:hypothetical protein